MFIMNTGRDLTAEDNLIFKIFITVIKPIKPFIDHL